MNKSIVPYYFLRRKCSFIFMKKGVLTNVNKEKNVEIQPKIDISGDFSGGIFPIFPHKKLLLSFVFYKKKNHNIKQMKIGILKEIKPQENRVSMTPAGVEMMVSHGHEIMVEKRAGLGSGFSDEAYEAAGAQMVDAPDAIFAACEMVMHVKEILPCEYSLLRKGQIVFTYLHLAADLPLIEALKKSGCTAIAYETVEDAGGNLPLLQPMSEVAGRMAIQEAARFLEKTQGGSGILMGGVTEPVKKVFMPSPAITPVVSFTNPKLMPPLEFKPSLLSEILTLNGCVIWAILCLPIVN